MLQVTEKHVEGDSGTGMAQMGVTINSGATHIHPHMGSVQGDKTLLGTLERII